MKNADSTRNGAARRHALSSEKAKIAVAAVALAAAALVLALNFGLLGGKKGPLPQATGVDLEIQKESDELARLTLEKAKRDPNVTIGTD